MNSTITGVGIPADAHPPVRPEDPRFSSGPCRKHPGWTVSSLDTSLLGQSHRSSKPKARLNEAITRSRDLIDLPKDWLLGIVPGSDTGAFEMAIWSLLGAKPVDAYVWENFSSDWAKDLKTLGINHNLTTAPYGELPQLKHNPENDLLFVYNGTTSGVMVPDLDWITARREGLVLCDATSSAFAVPLDFSKLDVVTWSWQKVLGGEAGFGMLALSPRAIERLEQPAPRPLPKLFTLTKNQSLIGGIFSGATINTPSMLAVEDLHSALDWAESIGGKDALEDRTRANFDALDQWVDKTPWISWLADDRATRSPTSMCLKVCSDDFDRMTDDQRQSCINEMTNMLKAEEVAFDIANYRTAPAGFRIWGGPTVETSDIVALTPWLEWSYQQLMQKSDFMEKING